MNDDAKREVVELLEARERALAKTVGRKPESLPEASDELELIAQCCLIDMAIWSVAKTDGDEQAGKFLSHAVQLLGAVRSESAADAKSHLAKIQKGKFEAYAGCARILLASIEAVEMEAHQAIADQKTQEFPAASGMMLDRIRFNCPQCKRSINAPMTAVGKKAPCPGCKQMLTVPPPAAALSAQSSRIGVTCACAKRIFVSDAMSGKRFKCPECGDINRVPTQAERDGTTEEQRPLES